MNESKVPFYFVTLQRINNLNSMKMKKFLLSGILLLSSMVGAKGAVDPNFHIYICFGQSNMEGAAQWETVDNYVDARFQMLATTDFTNPQRTKGNWYTATCPIVSPAGHLGPTDYFGRTMVAALPANVKIGVVAVAMGGSPIEMFDKDLYAAKLAANPTEWWAQLAKNYYGGNPYGRIIEMAKIAQQSGVIKGILLHQGCSNCGDPNWPNMVKKIYNDMLADLNLTAADVPLFVGETEYADMGGGCASHNAVVANIPTVIPTGHVVSAEGIPGNGQDAWHFSAAGYRIFGKRYAYKALEVMGLPKQKDASYTLPENLANFFGVSSISCDDVTVRVGGSKHLVVTGTFADGHKENLSKESTYSSSDFTVSADGTVTATQEKSGIVKVSYTDFTGQTHVLDVHVEANNLGPNHVLAVNNGTAGSNPWDKQIHCALSTPMVKGKTYVVKATVRADNGGDFGLWPIWSTSPNRDQWNNSADVQYLSSYGMTASYQDFTWEFVASFDHDRLQFVCGKTGGMVYMDDVSCMEKGGSTELVPNGNFESDDMTAWSVLGYTGQTIAITEDPTTDITHVQRDRVADNHYYTLDGCRLNGVPTQRGIYIVNGRKVIIK